LYGHLNPIKISCHICPHITGSTEFRKNVEILRTQANSAARLKFCIVWKTVVPSYYIISTVQEGTQFSMKRGILSRATEFAHVRRISMFSWNFAEFGTGRW